MGRSRLFACALCDWVEKVYDPADVKARFMAQWSGNPVTELILRRE